jgi:CspA family cold shock protein
MVSSQAVQQENFTAPHVRCTVKWFNLQKGYGFLAPDDGSADIFMHFSILEQSGCYHVCPGDEVVCETGLGKRGVQATKIHSIKSMNTSEEAPKVFPLPSPFMLEEKTGFVKWFNILKGYGFIQPDDNGRDIFIHTAVLRRIGIDRLPPGKRVRIKVFSTERGREAREVHLEDDDWDTATESLF